MKNKLMFFVLFGILSQNSFSQTFTVDFFPEKDNSMFSENNASSNGSGVNLFAGRTQMGTFRRALIKFNLATIPSNAVIDNVSLEMAVVRSAANTMTAHNFTLNKVLKDWGEGTSEGLGNGAAAQGNDATWQYAKFASSTAWTTLGGDFSPTVSATAPAVLNDYCVWSSVGMKNDITTWVAASSTNFGWIIKGEESTPGSAKGFSSREETVIPKPKLTITYSLPTIDKILINEVNPAKKWIEFYNPSANAVNLANYWLTNGAVSDNIGGGNVSVLNGSLVLNAGKYVVVAWINQGQSTGEIALFNKIPTDNTAIIKDYVQYGVANQTRATAAVTAQVWDAASAFLSIINVSTNSYSLNPAVSFMSGQNTNSTSFLIQKETPSNKNEVCPTTLTMSGTLINATYQSIGQLKSTGSASPTSIIKLKSNTSILLENLFIVNSGAVFEAKIENCVN